MELLKLLREKEDGLKMIHTRHAYENTTSVYLFNIIYSQFTSGVHACDEISKSPHKKRCLCVLWCCVTHQSNVAFMSLSSCLHRKPRSLPKPYLHCNSCRGIKSNVNICLLCMKKKSILSGNEKRGSPYIHFIKKWFCIKGADLISLKCADFILLCL